MKEKDVIIQRIKKLLRHSESAKKLGSLQEAEVFASKANELLLEYNLTLDQIPLEDLDSDSFNKWTYAERISYQCNQSGNRWKLDLIGTLTKYGFCSYTSNTYLKTFRIYGNMENVDIVIWQYNFLSIGLLRLAQEHHKALSEIEKSQILRYSFLKDFLLGAAKGIEKQLRKMREQQESEKLTGLMIYNAAALDKFIKIQVPNLKQARKQRPINIGQAYFDGLEAGSKYSITRPLGEREFKEKKSLL